jgi:hypothetical protein
MAGFVDIRGTMVHGSGEKDIISVGVVLFIYKIKSELDLELAYAARIANSIAYTTYAKPLAR